MPSSCPEQNNAGLRNQQWVFGRKTSRHTNTSDEGSKLKNIGALKPSKAKPGIRGSNKNAKLDSAS